MREISVPITPRQAESILQNWSQNGINIKLKRTQTVAEKSMGGGFLPLLFAAAWLPLPLPVRLPGLLSAWLPRASSSSHKTHGALEHPWPSGLAGLQGDRRLWQGCRRRRQGPPLLSCTSKSQSSTLGRSELQVWDSEAESGVGDSWAPS